MTKFAMEMLNVWPEPEAFFGRLLWFSMIALFSHGTQAIFRR